MRWFESFAADIRFALRSYARKPLAAITIVVVLALGIGANSGLYSVVQAFTRRAAPGIADGESLKRVYGIGQERRGAERKLRSFSPAEVDSLAAHREAFTGVAGWVTDDAVLQWRQGTVSRGVSAEFVTPDFWTTLGVHAPAGDRPGAEDFTAVVSTLMAKEIAGSPQEAVGARLLVNGVAVRVAGVAPQRFQGAVPHDEAPALWMPLAIRPYVRGSAGRDVAELASLQVVARVARGVSDERATAVAQRVAATMITPGSVTGQVSTAAVVPVWDPSPVAPPNQSIVGFAVLGVIALLILLVAFSNVSSLLVALAVGRRQEIAIRLSLGASRGRVIRQLLTETAVLALAGGFGGLMIYWGLITAVANRTATITIDLSPDFGTAAFTALLAVGTGLVFGVSPALHATRSAVGAALRDSAAGVTGKSRLQRVFVAAQIVFSQPLLLLLAVFLVILVPVQAPIARPVVSSLASVRFRPVRRVEDAARRRADLDTVIRRLGSDPTVLSVGLVPAAFSIASVADPQRKDAIVREFLEGTPPGYLAQLGVPLVLGRDVAFDDTAASEIRAVVGSSLARRLWKTGNPLGRQVPRRRQSGRGVDTVPIIIVGVYDDSYGTTRGEDRIFTAYRSQWRDDALLVRTRGNAAPLVPGVKAAIQSAAPLLPIATIQTQMEIESSDRRAAVLMSTASMAGGALALFLASMGLFAVVSLSVGQRRREIGLRIALGGQPRRVAAAFFAAGLRLSGVALLAGLPVSALVLRVAITQGILIVPEVSVTLLAAVIGAIVLVVASAASWLPARHAARVDPSLALRAN